MTEPFLLELAVGGFIEPLGRPAIPHIASRLVLLGEGQAPKPVLRILAERKLGRELRSEEFAFWLDGDPLNETLENVSVARRI